MIATSVMGVGGAMVGLVIGWATYPPTAWFAALELGVPSALVGVAIGALIGVITVALRRN